ncbi:MAG: YdcH family protein [Sneathiella sp.]|nr:YdcH family protein [Sneathiella sp.]
MSTTDYVVQLTEKHHRIDDKIHEEMLHPSADQVHITELKKEKLRLKQKIEKFSADPN